jgi:hypothetical protein
MHDVLHIIQDNVLVEDEGVAPLGTG